MGANGLSWQPRVWRRIYTHRPCGIAKNCGGNGYTIKKSEDIRPVMKMAMHKDTEKKPVIIEAYVDPLEPMVPPKAKSEFIQKISESFAKGQPYSERIGLTLYRNKFETI